MTNPKTISCQELKDRIAQESFTFIDVRDPDAFAAGHLEGAKNLDQQGLFDFIENADKDATVIVYCYRGRSSLMAAAMLIQNGFNDVYNLEGGYTAWSEL